MGPRAHRQQQQHAEATADAAPDSPRAAGGGGGARRQLERHILPLIVSKGSDQVELQSGYEAKHSDAVRHPQQKDRQRQRKGSRKAVKGQ